MQLISVVNAVHSLIILTEVKFTPSRWRLETALILNLEKQKKCANIFSGVSLKLPDTIPLFVCCNGVVFPEMQKRTLSKRNCARRCLSGPQHSFYKVPGCWFLALFWLTIIFTIKRKVGIADIWYSDRAADRLHSHLSAIVCDLVTLISTLTAHLLHVVHPQAWPEYIVLHRRQIARC